MKWGHGKLKTHFYLRVCPLCFRFWIPKSLIPHGKHTLIIFVLLKNCQNHSVQCTRLVSLRHASIFQTNTFVIAGFCVQTAATMFKLPHIWSNFHNIFTIFDIKKRLLSYIHPLLPQTNMSLDTGFVKKLINSTLSPNFIIIMIIIVVSTSNPYYQRYLFWFTCHHTPTAYSSFNWIRNQPNVHTSKMQMTNIVEIETKIITK